MRLEHYSGTGRSIVRAPHLNLLAPHSHMWGQSTQNISGSSPKRDWGPRRVDPFRTAVPLWGQITQKLSGLSPKRDCGSKKGFKRGAVTPLCRSLHPAAQYRGDLVRGSRTCTKTGRVLSPLRWPTPHRARSFRASTRDTMPARRADKDAIEAAYLVHNFLCCRECCFQGRKESEVAQKVLEP